MFSLSHYHWNFTFCHDLITHVVVEQSRFVALEFRLMDVTTGSSSSAHKHPFSASEALATLQMSLRIEHISDVSSSPLDQSTYLSSVFLRSLLIFSGSLGHPFDSARWQINWHLEARCNLSYHFPSNRCYGQLSSMTGGQLFLL